MFTGIIEELGKIKKIEQRGALKLIEIEARKIIEDVKIGDSVAVNGVCLTAVKVGKDSIAFEAMAETVKTTNLGILRIGEKVNLERSLRVGDRVGGHFVLGHVDCLGIIRKKGMFLGNLTFEIAVPDKFIKYCLIKGSIAIDGISLTIQEIKRNSISVYVIPHTLKNSTLSFKGPSDKVNIEFDTLAKSLSTRNTP